MKILVCIDNNNGLLFNNRRQSKDSAVIKKIGGITKQKILYINSFSQNMISQYLNNFIVNENMLEIATEDDFCFIENLEITNYANKISEIYLFKWNKTYPCDFKLDIDYKSRYILEKAEEIKGTSHEKITMEVWKCLKNQ